MNKKYRIVDGPESIQGSPEWHAFRKGKIGASMAGAIMGVSPFTTPLQLWEEIQFGITKTQNEAMKRGSAMEEEARRWLNNNTNISFKPIVLQRVDHPQIIASLDGYYRCEMGEVSICEIKCGGESLHEQAKEGRIPPYYYAQMQHQLDITGLDTMIYLSYFQGDGQVTIVKKNQEYCNNLLRIELAFLDSLINFNPPEPTDRDWVKIDDFKAIENVARYKELCEQIDVLEEEKEWLKQTIVSQIDHRRVIVGGNRIQKIDRKGGIEYQKIEALKDIDLDQYRKPNISSWRIY